MTDIEDVVHRVKVIIIGDRLLDDNDAEEVARDVVRAITAPLPNGWGTTAPTYFKGRLKVEYVYGRGDRPWVLTNAMRDSAARPVIGYYENPAQAMFDADTRFEALQ